MNMKQVQELLLQSLEHEIGGVKVYETAITCAVNADLKKEWKDYLSETQNHVAVLTKVCRAMGLDPEKETPGRKVVRHLGGALVEAMQMAKKAGDPAAELVACECVVNAETKDHLDWQLIGKVSDHLEDAKSDALRQAYDEIEDQEDEHLYHSKGWCRELWIEALGIQAVLPPPEERLKVKTAIGAAKAEASAEKVR
jgi:ferritin-like metal-binding protein YciE